MVTGRIVVTEAPIPTLALTFTTNERENRKLKITYFRNFGVILQRLEVRRPEHGWNRLRRLFRHGHDPMKFNSNISSRLQMKQANSTLWVKTGCRIRTVAVHT